MIHHGLKIVGNFSFFTFQGFLGENAFYWLEIQKKLYFLSRLWYYFRFEEFLVYTIAEMTSCAKTSVPDPFNGQTVNFILKPLKVIGSKTYVEKADLEHYWKNAALLLWQQHRMSSLHAKVWIL